MPSVVHADVYTVSRRCTHRRKQLCAGSVPFQTTLCHIMHIRYHLRIEQRHAEGWFLYWERGGSAPPDLPEVHISSAHTTAVQQRMIEDIQQYSVDYDLPEIQVQHQILRKHQELCTLYGLLLLQGTGKSYNVITTADVVTFFTDEGESWTVGKGGGSDVPLLA